MVKIRNINHSMSIAADNKCSWLCIKAKVSSYRYLQKEILGKVWIYFIRSFISFNFIEIHNRTYFDITQMSRQQKRTVGSYEFRRFPYIEFDPLPEVDISSYVSKALNAKNLGSRLANPWNGKPFQCRKTGKSYM